MSETLTQEPAATPESAAASAVARNLDILDQLMKPDVQKALAELVDQLPKIAEMVSQLTKAYDLAKSLATDPVLIEDLKGGFEEFVKPIGEKAKGIAAAAVEAGDRAQQDTSTIGLFGILKMLKDPQVQKTLRFTQAFLDVLSERQKQR